MRQVALGVKLERDVVAVIDVPLGAVLRAAA
jgi:hypothetical protein